MRSNGSTAFAGTAALVTGGGSGIGLACAQRLAAAGAAVTICGRTEGRLVDAAASLGDAARWVIADVCDEEAMTRAAETAAEPRGALHVVVANAGSATALGPLAVMDVAAFERDLTTNTVGTFVTIKAAAPMLAAANDSAVVAISSIAGALTHPLLAPYSVSKAALDMLVRNAAEELAPYGIRVNAVRPGLVPTGASDPLVAHDPTRTDYLAQMPLGRLGTVDDIAAAVAFLASPEASWITGQVLNVDGGHTLRRGPDLRPLMEEAFAPVVAARLGPPARTSSPEPS